MDGNPLRIFGTWTSLITPRLGENLTLDSAAKYFLEGRHAFLTQNFDSEELARASTKALQNLRIALAAPNSERNSCEVIVAVKLLASVEVNRSHLHTIISLQTDSPIRSS
jgi:hypothetical protein